MRRWIAVLAVFAVVAISSPRVVEAQHADPVGLIASAAILPFWSAQPYLTIFEVTSLGPNPDMHIFFFTETCVRAFSIPFSMSEHDAAVAFSNDLGLTFNGLAAIARSTNNITPEPLQSPITARGHRINLANDAISVVDAIGAQAAELPTETWNPLRSGASTVTVPFTTTRWWFACPQNNTVSDLTFGIPPLPPAPALVRMRVYDLDELPLFDLQIQCNCLTVINPATIHPTAFHQEGRLVEMVSYTSPVPPDNPGAFVLYREVFVNQPPGLVAEDFARAPGMAAASLIQGVPVQGAR